MVRFRDLFILATFYVLFLVFVAVSFIFIDCFLFFKPVLYLIFVFLFYILQTNIVKIQDSKTNYTLFLESGVCVLAHTH